MYSDYNEEKEESYYADDDNRGFDKEKLKKIIFYVLIGVVALILILLMAKGCSRTSNKGSGMAIDTKPSISLKVKSQTLSVGQTFEMVGEVYDTSASNPTITWYSENSNVASVTDEGEVLAISEGTTNIVAVYKKDGKVYDNKCLITVTSNNIKVEGISFDQEKIDLGFGESFLLQLSITPTNAKVDDIVYESSDRNIVLVDSKGYIYGIGVGSTTVTAKTVDGSVGASITVNVLENGSETPGISLDPTSIKLIKVSNGLSIGTTSGIEYEILPTNATNNHVTWSSQNPSIATVDSNGIITGISQGTTLIIATTDNGLSDKIMVTVENSNVAVQSISLIGDKNITMEIGGTYQLSHQITPENATNKNVKYTSNNSQAVYVSSDGRLVALQSGVSVITISTEDGNKYDFLTVSVKSSSGSGSGTDGSSGGSDSGTGGEGSGGSEGTGGGSSGGSSGGSGGTAGSTCSINSVTLSSNQYSDGARTYNGDWDTDPQKAFKKSSPSPALTVNNYDDCVKSVKYSLWRNNSTSTKKQTVIKTNAALTKDGLVSFGTTNGYYYVELTITSKNGEVFTKQYYSVVNVSNTESTTSNSYISITPNNDATNGKTTFTINKLSSSVKYVYYCTTINGKSCTPETYSLSFTNTSTKTQIKAINYSTTTQNTSTGSRIYFRAKSSSSWLGSVMWFDIQKPKATIDTTKPSISIVPNIISGNYKKYMLNVSDSGRIKSIQYCSTSSTNKNATCTPTSSISTGLNQSYIGSLKKGEYRIICVKATDNSNNISQVCQSIYQKSS